MGLITSCAFRASNFAKNFSNLDLGFEESRVRTMSEEGRVKYVGDMLLDIVDTKGVVIKFNFIDDGVLNAHILPWGELRVHSGMTSFAKNDHELAMVIAHELAHLHLAHFDRLREIKSFSNSRTASYSSAEEERKKSLLMLEYEADELAIAILKEAGFSPKRGIRIMKRLADVSNSEKSKTHPPFLVRYRRLIGKIAVLERSARESELNEEVYDSELEELEKVFSEAVVVKNAQIVDLKSRQQMR